MHGHMFAGWYTEEKGDNLNFIETTAIGDATMSYALAKVAAKLLYKDEVENGNFKSGESEIVDIEKARESGILPNDVQ
jgi:hypothetical protein